jgi:hypothetical protein
MMSTMFGGGGVSKKEMTVVFSRQICRGCPWIKNFL